MNKLVEKLIAQNYETVQSPSGEGYREFNKEKFAECIVWECLDVINAAKSSFPNLPADVALDLAAKGVKAYFGAK